MSEARISFGENGIRIFSIVFMINTFLCMSLNVWLSKIVKLSSFGLAAGIALGFAALLIFGLFKELLWAYYVAVLFQTVGELLFTSVSQHLLFEIMPKNSRQGSVYSVTLLMQFLGKFAGSAVAFYFIADVHLWLGGMAMLAAVALASTIVLQRRLVVQV